MSLRLLAALLFATGLSACATSDPVSRNLALSAAPVPAPEAREVMRDYSLARTQVLVPPSLRATESNAYYPNADIVWRGDPIGDRHAQIAEIFRTAADRAGAGLDGKTDIVAQIVVVRFHGVTERTRYSVGGVYHMVFDLTVRDAATGEILEETRRLEAALPAPGGQAALQLENSGQTEKVRVLDYLSFFLRTELSGPVAPPPAT